MHALHSRALFIAVPLMVVTPHHGPHQKECSLAQGWKMRLVYSSRPKYPMLWVFWIQCELEQ
jgi:hypothetical protein